LRTSPVNEKAQSIGAETATARDAEKPAAIAMERRRVMASPRWFLTIGRGRAGDGSKRCVSCVSWWQQLIPPRQGRVARVSAPGGANFDAIQPPPDLARLSPPP